MQRYPIRNINGIREGSYLWFTFLKILLKNELALLQSRFDDCAFVGTKILILGYVNDFLILGSSENVTQYQTTLGEYMIIIMSNVTDPLFFLGIDMSGLDNGFFELSQVEYIKNLLNKHLMRHKKRNTSLAPFFNRIYLRRVFTGYMIFRSQNYSGHVSSSHSH